MEKKKDYTYEVWTIPNVLTLLRFILVPVFIVFYCGLNMPTTAFVVFLISQLSDSVDGIVARKFNMVSEVGRLTDPIADKFTQGVVFFCLATRFRWITILAVVLIIKETILVFSSLRLTHKCEKVYGAEWYGKANSCLLFITLILHLAWTKIIDVVSLIMVIACVAMMIFSGIRYLIRNTKLLRSAK